ncbi:DUF6918 family protein [Corynebacterium riegelii]
MPQLSTQRQRRNRPRRRTTAARPRRHHPSDHRPRTSALNWPKSGDAVPKGVNRYLPQVVSELQPLFERFQTEGSGSFGAFLSDNENEVVEKILNAADGATGDMPSAIQKVYSTLRGKVGKIVAPALPELGNIIERYAK